LVPISPASADVADVADKTGSASDSACSSGGSIRDPNVTSTCQSLNSFVSWRGTEATWPMA